jgi:hypothetical protein
MFDRCGECRAVWNSAAGVCRMAATVDRRSRHWGCGNPSLAGPVHRGALRRSCPPTACGRLLLYFALQSTPARRSGGGCARGRLFTFQVAPFRPNTVFAATAKRSSNRLSSEAAEGGPVQRPVKPKRHEPSHTALWFLPIASCTNTCSPRSSVAFDQLTGRPVGLMLHERTSPTSMRHAPSGEKLRDSPGLPGGRSKTWVTEIGLLPLFDTET